MRIFFLLLLGWCCTFYGAAQASADILLEGLKNDTVLIRLDTTLKKIIVKRKDGLFAQKDFSIGKDTAGNWQLKNKSDLLFQLVNVYAKDSILNADFVFNQFADTTDISILFSVPFEVAKPTADDSKQRKATAGYPNWLVYLLGGLGLLLLILFGWSFIKWKQAEEWNKAHQKKESIEFGGQLLEHLQKSFPGWFSDLSGKADPKQLLGRLEREWAAQRDKVEQKEGALKQIREQLQSEQEKVRLLQGDKASWQQEKEQLIRQQTNELATVKAEISELADYMLHRYGSFIKEVKQGSDEDIKRRILSFHIGFAQMANAIFRKQAGIADDTNVLNLKLLRGESVEPRKTIDQFTSEGDVQYWVVLLIKLLEANGVQKINDAFINGDKIQLKG
jgi:hypothetical protein